MHEHSSPRKLRDQIVGRTIAGVIARPGRSGEPPVVLMLRFDDDSVVEFVSPRSDRLLKETLRRSAPRASSASTGSSWNESQLTLDGLLMAGSAC
jgi:hypothetical protein